MKTQRALLALTVWLTACVPTSTTAYPVPPTQGYPAPATETVVLTAMPTTAAPPTETPVPTATTEPEVWEIWFRGSSCEGANVCGGPGVPVFFYSIKSDGSELRQLEVGEFPPAPAIPDSAPPSWPKEALVSPPTYSPDGKALLYFGHDRKLYAYFPSTNIGQTLFDSNAHKSFLGPHCWSPNDEVVIFAEIWRASQRRSPVIYQVDVNGQTLTELFTLSGLEEVWFGDCSPDGQEMIFSVSGASPVEASGLYRVNLNTRQWQQILQSYSASQVQTIAGDK